MNPHVIDTRAPAPRKIGGGLDDPEPTTTHGRHRIHRPDRIPPGPASSTRPPGNRTPTGHGPSAGAVQADTGTGHGDRTPPCQPAPPLLPIRPAEPASAIDTLTGQAVDELAAVRVTLGALVPVGDTVSTLRLVQMVAAKLASHGPQCAAVINPPRGSITVDEARARCRAVLDVFDPVERHAVLSLLTHDVRAASR